MRIMIAALAVLAIEAYYLFQTGAVGRLAHFDPNADFGLIKDLALVVLGVYLLIEGVLAARRRAVPAAVSAAAPPESTLQYKQLLQERDGLKTAYEEANERAKKAEAQSQAKQRPPAIDAELANLLGLLQEKGRLVDFLMDDITPYSDAQVGAAARVVHQGCSGLLREYFKISPVHEGKEGEKAVLAAQFDARRYRLVGRAAAQPPYSGEVLHRGWKADAVKVPRVAAQEEAHPPYIITPAEVEVA